MKKKGFCFKRAVSLLLAAVMIVTAAPQTSLTALAAEQGMTADTPDVSEDLDIKTTEDGKTSESEDAAGQDGTDADGDIGDESADVPSDDGAGVGDDEQAGGSDNADQPDNAGDHTDDPDGINQGDDTGDADEAADPEEDTDYNQTTNDESVSGNDLEGVMSVFEDELDEGPGYSEIIDDETTDEGKPYRRLIIDVSAAETADVTVDYEILLGYYGKQIKLGKCEEFNCVEFRIADGSYSMKEAYINAAIDVMDMENKEIVPWIDYSFWNDNDSDGVNYALSRPHVSESETEIDATCTVTRMPNQGVKINVKTTDFPAESVGISYNKEEENAFAECWDNAEPKDLRLLAWGDGVSPSVIESDGIWYDEYSYVDDENETTVFGSNFGMDIKGIQAGQDYLITPLYTDEDVVTGSTRELTAGQRSGSSDGAGVSDVTWTSLNEELITIKSGTDAVATLDAADETGEAYYYVTYKHGGKEWLELHSVRVAYVASDGTLKYIGEVVKNYHEDGDLAGAPYLRLCIDEAEAAEKNGSKNITPILEFYKEKELQVNCVELNIVDESSGTSSKISSGTSSEKISPGTVKMDYINGAQDVMGKNSDDPNGASGFWIDYNFRNDQTDTGVELSLSSPSEAKADVKVAFTLTELKNQGLKVKFDTTAFPAERVTMNYNLSVGDKYEDTLENDTLENDTSEKGNGFRLFTHSSGTPKAMVDTNEDQGCGYYGTGVDEGDGHKWTSVHFDNIKPLGTTEYLAASIYEDEERPVVGGKPVQLKAGTRAGAVVEPASATWKLFDTDKATIDKNGELTAWSDEDAIYYYVKYKVGSAQYLEVHEMWVERQDVKIEFVESDITMEMDPYRNPNAEPARKYLRLRFYPSDAECDLRDPKRFRWETTENGGEDNPVIDFVYYYYDKTNSEVGEEVKWDADGKMIPPEGMNNPQWDANGKLVPTDEIGVTWGGDIIALSEGTAKVKVSYLGEADVDEDSTAECTVKVVKPLTWENDIQQMVDAMDLYAVTDLDTKLSDVTQNAPLAQGWAWEDPNTSLANFKGMDGCQFPAVYTDPASEKTFNCPLWVRFVTVTGIEIDSKNEDKKEDSVEPDWFENWVPDSIKKGDKITLRYSYRMENLNEENFDEENEAAGRKSEYDKVKEKFEKKYSIEWTSNPATSVGNGETYEFKAPSITKAQKYTITVSVKDKQTNKVYLKNNYATTVTVTDVFDWSKVEVLEVSQETKKDNQRDEKRYWLRFNVYGMSEKEYKEHPLTVVSEDPAILKLKKEWYAESLKDENEKVLLDENGNVLGTNVVVLCEYPKPATDPTPGTAWIKMTAADEIKSSRRFCFEFPDKEPKLIESAVTINQKHDDKSAEVTVRTNSKYPLDTTIKQITLYLDKETTPTQKFTAEVIVPSKDETDSSTRETDDPATGDEENEGNDGNEGDDNGGDVYNDYTIRLTLKDADIKKGKHTVTLMNLKVKQPDNAGTKADLGPYELKLTVNVTDTVPKVTFKQAKKVNLFYNDEEGYGVLRLNVTGEDIDNITDLKLVGCDFEVTTELPDKKPADGGEPEAVHSAPELEPGEYYVKAKDLTKVTNKKGTLNYKINGYSTLFEANFTVATETKKPTIVLSQKSDTLYPLAGYENSWLWMTDKATGEEIVPSKVVYVENKKQNPDGYSKDPEIRGDEIKWDLDPDKNTQWKEIEGKDDYRMIATKEGGIVFHLLESGYKKRTDKFDLKIKEDNWAEPIAVSYSIKVDVAKPKLVLGKSTLTLNKNDAVYRAQQERTSLHLKGTSDAVYQGNGNWVRFDGQDEKSREILRKDNWLVLQYRDDWGDVIVRFNDNKMDVGTYKFKVSVGNDRNGLIASTDLKVKIVDVSIAKTLKVTAKGSIDVMNREGTSIAYTPKISNISGKVVNGWLEGMDSDMFRSEWDGSKLIVKANYDNTYNTKHTYQVRAVFEVDTEEYERLKVSTDTTKPLKIKVKQGKPKLTASTAGNTIYRQLDSTVDIKLSAMLNKQEVEIENVWLLNFTDDFELRTTPAYWIEEGEEGEEGEVMYPYDAIYNPQTKSVRLGLINRYEAVDAVKSGKPCKVKLAVRYCDQAGNEKVAQVTCSVVVR